MLRMALDFEDEGQRRKLRPIKTLEEVYRWYIGREYFFVHLDSLKESIGLLLC